MTSATKKGKDAQPQSATPAGSEAEAAIPGGLHVSVLQTFAQCAAFSGTAACAGSKLVQSLNPARAQPPLHVLQTRRAGTRLCCASCRLPLRGLMLLTWHPRVSYHGNCTWLQSSGALCVAAHAWLGTAAFCRELSAAPERCCYVCWAASWHTSPLHCRCNPPETATCLSCSPSSMLPGVVWQAPQEQPLHPNWPSRHLSQQGRLSAAAPGS